MHMYHYIYKITCKITNRFYIGMHSTYDLQDNYFGSGKLLKYSIKKYGKENHSLEILSFYNNRSELSKAEKNIVNKKLIKEDLCMNLTVGGDGGYNEHAVKSNRLKKGKKWKDIFKSQETLEFMINVAKDNYYNIERYNFKNLDIEKLKNLAKKGNKTRMFNGYIHSKETKQKIADSNKSRDWSERKSEVYRKMISDKTKEAIAKLDMIQIQIKAQKGRKKYWEEKHKVLDAEIIKMINNGLTPTEISNKLNISTRTYYNRLNVINNMLKNTVDK